MNNKKKEIKKEIKKERKKEIILRLCSCIIVLSNKSLHQRCHYLTFICRLKRKI